MSEWNPEDYHRNSAAQFEWALGLLKELGLQPHERVLDIGCGEGKVTAEIARQVPRGAVVGLDYSHEMIRFAQQSYPSAAYPNLRFMHGDAGRLAFAEEFDAVFSNATLHWILDHRPVLKGISRALKPGGRLLLQMGGMGNMDGLIAASVHVIARAGWKEYFKDFQFPWGFYGPEDYLDWMGQAGLKPTRVELFPKDMVHPAPAALAGWLRPVWIPYLEKVPETRRGSFLDDLVAEYLKAHPPDSQGCAHTKMVRLEVEGIRESPGARAQPDQ